MYKVTPTDGTCCLKICNITGYWKQHERWNRTNYQIEVVVESTSPQFNNLHSLWTSELDIYEETKWMRFYVLKWLLAKEMEARAHVHFFQMKITINRKWYCLKRVARKQVYTCEHCHKLPCLSILKGTKKLHFQNSEKKWNSWVIRLRISKFKG